VNGPLLFQFPARLGLGFDPWLSLSGFLFQSYSRLQSGDLYFSEFRL
jgi:hypothetical protein